ncbi:MAG: hypothetical protein E7505_02240 [Ruminococcus sp.]|nr:hypothetical protein [Ruminococcus sp.]
MNIYELSYVATVMCYRNIDKLEERHVVCGKTDENLYVVIYEEFGRRFDMLINVVTSRALNEEEEAFLYYMAICCRGYRQWDKPRIIKETIDCGFVDFVLKNVNKACYGHKRLSEEMMKKLNKSVHDRVFTHFVLSELQ